MDSSLLLTIVAAETSFFMLLVTIYFFYKKLSFHQENITNASSSSPSSLTPLSLTTSSPPSSFPQNRKHHVFPSFHGADVRKSFLSHILKEFTNKGIDIFIDNNIERSKPIGPELIEAIRGSRIAIVLLSRNYASSTWCMNELVEIMNCREVLGQKVITIFYEVDPTDVKKQTGDFGKVFERTCKGKSKEDIRRWRDALKEVAKIAGYHSNNWVNEAHMIEEIATDVFNKLLNSTPSRDFDHLVGMGAHMEKIEQLLRPDLDDVRMIGILGPPGIGKTTIARYLYNCHSKYFQLTVFMENIKSRFAIRACSNDYGVKLYLQKQFMSEISKHQLGVKIPHLGVVEDMLRYTKVFVVLDDVDKLQQLEAMANKTCWFGSGSRIIITTQDQKLLKQHRINHIYRVGFPSRDEALEMFCIYAFDQKFPKDGFTGLAWEVTHLAGNLPLALEVMGSYFRGMTKHEWSTELPRLRTRLDDDEGKIESILKFSYDALPDEAKDTFLHIACFFNNEEVERVVEYLKTSSLDVRKQLRILTEKSLISTTDYGRIHMHSLLVQLGIDIVRKQSVGEPGGRQFLVDEDICEVLRDYTANTKSVVGIISKDWEELPFSERAFEGMPNLKFLRFIRYDRDGDIHSDNASEFSLVSEFSVFPECLRYISTKLRLLDWDYCPMTSLSFIDNLEFLVELRMKSSKLERLWDGIKPLPNLKRMDLSNSLSLVELPSSIGNAKNLQDLNLSRCLSLVKLPSSIGNANNLQNLNLSRCLSLVKLPSSIGNATNLINLDLSECSSLVELPSSIGNATNLTYLNLSECSSLVELPSSIGNATNLTYLNLSECSSLVELPSSIGNATNLQYLNLRRCSSLVKLPSSNGNATNLRNLFLSECSSLVELPSSIWNATNLTNLDLFKCSSLVELPLSIGNATNLQYLNLRRCSSLVKLPSSIGNATNLTELDLRECSSLVELPSSIGNATQLKELKLSFCSSLVELPSSIGNVTNLIELDLSKCSSLVELTTSIGNLHRLWRLTLSGCSKLEVLPTNVNLASLTDLRLDDCSLLKSFPEISTSIEHLSLVGTSVEEVPSSIRSWSRLKELKMSYSENLKEFPHALDSITELHLTDTEIQEIGPWVKGCSRLSELILTNMKKLVSISELPDSLDYLDADNCESLERLDCSFSNSWIHLNFGNCFKLNQDARNIIIQTSSTCGKVVLPGEEVPAYFNFRSSGNSLTVKLNEKRLISTSMKFRACILLVLEAEPFLEFPLGYKITSNHNATAHMKSWEYLRGPILSEHLYIFTIEIPKSDAKELDFVFENECNDPVNIKECGIRQLLELHDDEDHESVRDDSSDESSGGNEDGDISPVPLMISATSGSNKKNMKSCLDREASRE